MEDKILEIMTCALKTDREKLMENFDCQDSWDSLSRVEILFELEEEFDIFFEEEELSILVTPKLLYDAAIRKVE